MTHACLTVVAQRVSSTDGDVGCVCAAAGAVWAGARALLPSGDVSVGGRVYHERGGLGALTGV
jgi:hypothetical protein